MDMTLGGQLKIFQERQDHANVYLLKTKRGCVLIDPALDPDELHPQDWDNLQLLVATHGHYDHIRLADVYRAKKPGLKLLGHQLSKEVYLDPYENCSSLFWDAKSFAPADLFLDDGESYALDDELSLKAYHMPGHSRDSLVYLLRKREGTTEKTLAIIGGDLLFMSSVGRSDLVGSDPQDLSLSLQRLIALHRADEALWDAKVPWYPGHGAVITLERELLFNPFLKEAAALLERH